MLNVYVPQISPAPSTTTKKKKRLMFKCVCISITANVSFNLFSISGKQMVSVHDYEKRYGSVHDYDYTDV